MNLSLPTRFALLFAALVLPLVACSSESHDDSSGDDHSNHAGSGGSASGAAGAGGDAGGGGLAGQGGSAAGAAGTAGGSGSSGAPGAPVMKSVSPLSGALHVAWSLPAGGCEKVRVSKKIDAGDYAVAATLAGTATSLHDTQVTAGATHCYTAACLVGTEVSPESNEKCGKP